MAQPCPLVSDDKWARTTVVESGLSPVRRPEAGVCGETLVWGSSLALPADGDGQ